jgi:hypothetical protein
MPKKRLAVLHRFLDGEGPQPLEHWIGRICEEFHVTPTEAIEQWRELPVGLLEGIIEARAYAHAKLAYDHADTPELQRALPRTPLMALVKRIDFELAQEDIDARV